MASWTGSVGSQSGFSESFLHSSLSIDSSRSPSRLGEEEDNLSDIVNLSRSCSNLSEIPLLTDADCTKCKGTQTGIKVLLACGHFFHHDCILENLRQDPKCPLSHCQEHIDCPRIEVIIEGRTQETKKWFKRYLLIIPAVILSGAGVYFWYYKPRYGEAL
jgi:hypothetical protein